MAKPVVYINNGQLIYFIFRKLYMLSFLKKKKERSPEEEFYQNAYHIHGGFAVFTAVWAIKNIKGDVICTEDLLIEADAEVHGDILCRRCHIKGKVHGNVYTWESLVIGEYAKVHGNVTAVKLEVLPGAFLSGSMLMTDLVAIPERVLNINRNNLRKYEIFGAQKPVELSSTMVSPDIAEIVLTVTPASEKPTVAERTPQPVYREPVASKQKAIIEAPAEKPAEVKPEAKPKAKPAPAVAEADGHWW